MTTETALKHLAWVGPAALLGLTLFLRQFRLFIRRRKAAQAAAPAAPVTPPEVFRLPEALAEAGPEGDKPAPAAGPDPGRELEWLTWQSAVSDDPGPAPGPADPVQPPPTN